MNAQSTDLVIFDQNEIAVFGNKLLAAIVLHEAIREEAEAALQQASKQENFFDVEIAKALVFLHSEETIDLYKIYGDDKASSASLYRQILVSLGVLKRTITDDDTVEYAFTDTLLENNYYFPSSMNDPKKEGESEEAYKTRTSDYTRRRAQRNALNNRLARCCKAAIALIESGADASSLVYRENKDTGAVEVVLTKGPKEIVGTKGEVVIVTGNAAKAEGASLTPTFSGLAKVADAKHKVAPAAAKSGEGATRKETDGTATNAEADFLALMNTAVMAIKSREGVFTDTERTVMLNLFNEIKGLGKAAK